MSKQPTAAQSRMYRQKMSSPNSISRRTTSKRLKLSPAKYRKLCEYVYARDKWCLFCGSPNNLTPAHIVGRGQGGDDSPRNVVAACIRCHKLFDAYAIELPDNVAEMLENEPIQL